MSEPCGEFSEGGQAVALLFPARGLADAVGHHAHEALGQLGHFLHQFLILRLRKSQDVAVGQRACAERECFHSGIGQSPGNLAGVDIDDDRFAAEFAARLELSLEKDKHGVRGSARVNQDIAPLEAQIFRLAEEPFDLVVRQVRK